jgi:hypothetical protein
LGRLLETFAAAYNIKVLVSEYQPIDMHCIMSPVKFDSGLSISFLRNRQLFAKKGCQKITFSNSSKFSLFTLRHSHMKVVRYVPCKGEEKKRPAIHLTGIDTIDRSGTSMLTNSKGLNPISPKKGEKKETYHLPDRR